MERNGRGTLERKQQLCLTLWEDEHARLSRKCSVITGCRHSPERPYFPAETFRLVSEHAVVAESLSPVPHLATP